MHESLPDSIRGMVDQPQQVEVGPISLAPPNPARSMLERCVTEVAVLVGSLKDVGAILRQQTSPRSLAS